GCHAEVGRPRDGRPARLSGYCSKCRMRYTFVPALAPDALVAGQYRVLGCLAYGGLGWIYLAQDERVSNRWVVLKGVLNAADPDSMAIALAERQFLARVEHPNVVRIYNVVEHAGAGYIVMEYVGGKTLKTVLRERRQAGLVLDLPTYQTTHRYRLPAPAEETLFRRHESLYRFLMKATAHLAKDRYQRAEDMAQALEAVLREITAAGPSGPRPAPSKLFG